MTDVASTDDFDFPEGLDLAAEDALPAKPRNPFLTSFQQVKVELGFSDLPDGDGICGNAACVGGKIPNYEGGQDADCPECLKRIRLERLQQEFAASDIPVSELLTEWESVDLSHASWQAAQRYCNSLKRARQQGYNAVFAGPPGRGKTLAAALVCRMAIEQGMSARMLTAQDVIGMVSASFKDHAHESEQEIIEKLSKPDFLVLDDLAAGETKGRTLELRVFTALIDKREKAKRPTIITSNLTAGQALEDALGYRAFERIRYKAASILFDGLNQRERKHRAEVAELDAFVMSGQAPASHRGN